MITFSSLKPWVATKRSVTERFTFAPNTPILKQGGYSLVEVLVAITVLLVALVGPLTIAQTGLKRSVFSREQTMAIFLAQDALETVVKVREDAALNATDYTNLTQLWSDMTAINTECQIGSGNTCSASLDGTGQASVDRCSGTACYMEYDASWTRPYQQGAVTGEVTKYERTLQVDVNNDYAYVTSTVSWGDDPEQQVTMDTYIYNVYYERN